MATDETGPDEGIIAAMEGERAIAGAHLDRDWDAIDGLLHPDWIALAPDGMIEGRDDYLASLRAGDRTWERADAGDLAGVRFGTTVRLVGVWTARGVNAGSPFDYRARFVSVWAVDGENWRNVAFAAAEITG